MSDTTIVILGNGFDLANNLKTSYSDYFKYRISQLGLNDQFGWMNEANQIKTYGDFLDYTERFVNEDASFWDLYFYFRSISGDFNGSCWNNIESEIKSVVVKNDQDEPNTHSKPNPLFHSSMINGQEFVKKDRIFNYSTVQSKKSTLQGKFLCYYLIQKYWTDYSNEVYEALKSELYLFENSFRLYIYEIMLNLKKKNKQYRDNFLKLVPSRVDQDIYLINFNYTKIESVDLKTSNDKVRIKRSDKEYSISELNIHGESEGLIIFGIDQSDIDVDDPAYIFTKTYRKMEYHEKVKSIPLPNPRTVKEIVFFGHSLAEADYSYFQSLFDFYDLYHGEIRLSFIYSHYNLKDQKKIDIEQLKGITGLLAKYGETMDNKNHGRNLKHKLLLEGRLKIRVMDFIG